jgi:hypothetical protein
MVHVNKEVRRWVEQAMKIGYDWDEIEKHLEDNGIEGNAKKAYKKAYQEQDKTKLKMSWLEKRKLKKYLKKLRKSHDISKKVMENIWLLTTDKAGDAQEELLKLKENLIDAIIGNEEKKIEGLMDVFDATDLDTGKPVEFTRKQLREMDITEVTDIFDDLIDELEKNI